MAPRTLALVAGAALAAFSAGSAFLSVPSSQRLLPRSREGAAANPLLVSHLAARLGPEADRLSYGFGILVLLTGLVAVGGLQRQAGHCKGTSTRAVVVQQQVPAAFPSSFQAAFAGATRAQPRCRVKKVIAKLRGKHVLECNQLFFVRSNYKRRYLNKLRNRSYNLAVKTEFKQKIMQFNRYPKALYKGQLTPAPTSMEEVWKDVKEGLDEVCLTLDRASIQGVIYPGEAAQRKEQILDRLYLAVVQAGLMKRNRKDLFTPFRQRLGYQYPKCHWLREPRPWMLPGFKTPQMMRTEFFAWRRVRRDRLRKELEAQGA